MEYHIGNLAFDSDYLEHYGVLGMKWGVRRYQNPDGSLTAEGRAHRKEYDPDYVQAHSGKSVKYMSTTELTRINNRLNQEKMYNQYLQSQSAGRRYMQAWFATDRKLSTTLIKLGRTDVVQGGLRSIGQTAVADILKVLGVLVPKK